MRFLGALRPRCWAAANLDAGYLLQRDGQLDKLGQPHAAAGGVLLGGQQPSVQAAYRPLTGAADGYLAPERYSAQLFAWVGPLSGHGTGFWLPTIASVSVVHASPSTFSK
jgi:hypothetical protein